MMERPMTLAYCGMGIHDYQDYNFVEWCRYNSIKGFVKAGKYQKQICSLLQAYARMKDKQHDLDLFPKYRDVLCYYDKISKDIDISMEQFLDYIEFYTSMFMSHLKGY